MRIPTNRYLVKIDSRVNDTFEAPGGMKFFRALNLGNVQWYKNTRGRVLLSPDGFSGTFPTKCTYRIYGQRKLIYYDRFYGDILPGDEVYFNYLAIRDGYKLDSAKLEFLIGADDINAYVRGGVMYAQTGRCIFSSITKAEWEEATGNVKESSIIIPDYVKQVSFKQAGRVVAVGKNWKGFANPEMKVGDIVVHDGKRIDWLDENKKLGSLYYNDINLILKHEPQREDFAGDQ
jgi:co-chaperonin GroES (HSP10)